MSQLTYLASPYSHPDPSVRIQRFLAACKFTAKLMLEGHLVFAPIPATHPMAELEDLPTDWTFWERLDREMISHCYKVIVLKLDGWQESKGVAAEIKIAKDLGLPVEYSDP